MHFLLKLQNFTLISRNQKLTSDIEGIFFLNPRKNEHHIKKKIATFVPQQHSANTFFGVSFSLVLKTLTTDLDE